MVNRIALATWGPEPSPSLGSEREPSAMANKVDILVVDDSTSNLLALEAMLSELGQNLVKASSGTEALKRLLQQDFALILMDVHMPGMDGLETAEIIRSRERSRFIPIVFLTAYSPTDAQIVRGYSIGAVDFLFKPIVPEILRSKVSVFVDLFKKTEEVKRQARLLREAEAREHERRLAETQQRYAEQLLREEMEHGRRIAEAQAARADELQSAQAALTASNERFRLLAETANQLLLGTRPEELIGGVYSRLSEHLHLEVYLNYLVGPDGETLHLESYGGLSAEVVRPDRIMRFGQGVCGMVASTQAPIVCEDVQRSSDPTTAYLRSYGVSAYACYPLLADGNLLGTLSFGTRRRHRFHDDEHQVMKVVSSQVAMALERARLIDELSRRAWDLADADRRKDEFLAMLAHELRNPLAPMLNAAHTLRDGVRPGDAVGGRAASAMGRQVRHMIRLVDDLLDVSRIERGKIELRKEITTFESVVEHAVQTSLPVIEDRGHSLFVLGPPETVSLVADPTRLAQIIANLLSNAAKYTDPGGKIGLSWERAEPTLILRVRDNGVGIAPAMLSRVFDIFVQGERGADRAQGGLGLGLTLVRRLVEMHGGTVAAYSEGQGHGSEFVVQLPIGDVPEGAVSKDGFNDSPHPPESRDSRARRVVLVEDNDDSRETLRDLLERRGHEVSEARDGASGVEVTLSVRPDVALIDIGLPGLDGYAVAARLREQMNGPRKTRLVALTGYGQPDDRRRAIEAGFDAHIVKPIDFKELTRLLEELP
jgi:signal transduction histidine kinase/DNA-binding response OmpR family regulator